MAIITTAIIFCLCFGVCYWYKKYQKVKLKNKVLSEVNILLFRQRSVFENLLFVNNNQESIEQNFDAVEIIDSVIRDVLDNRTTALESSKKILSEEQMKTFNETMSRIKIQKKILDEN